MPRSRALYRFWAGGGALLGLLLTLMANLPAAWLADLAEQGTEGRLQLANAEGTLWRGSALPVLTGGPGSRDASVLASRLAWSLTPIWLGLRLELNQACCIAPGLALEWRPGAAASSITLLSVAGRVGEWPAAWLEGLGAPWNTLKPGGQLRLLANGLSASGNGNEWQLRGQAELNLLQTSSKISTLDPLGSYRFAINALPDQPLTLSLSTLEGALQLQGQGEWRAKGGLHFRGEARATPGQEPALNNLLNIIGRRQGAVSVFSYPPS